MNTFTYARHHLPSADEELIEDEKRIVANILKRLRDTAYETDNLVHFVAFGDTHNIKKNTTDNDIEKIAELVARAKRPQS